MTTHAQTEARAIARYEVFADPSYYDLWAVRPVGEQSFNATIHAASHADAEAIATALAAKDAELAAERAALRLAADRADRAEAQLAEARKALDPFAKYASENGFGLNHKSEPLPDADGVGWVYLTNGDFRAARRAREAQGGER